MAITLEQFKKAKYQTCTLPYLRGGFSNKQAFIHSKNEHGKKLIAWREKYNFPKHFYDKHVFELGNGYSLEFNAEYDDYPRYDDIKAQGYVIDWVESRCANTPEFYSEYGANYQRDSDGDINFCIPFTFGSDCYFAIGYLPKGWIMQFTEKGADKQTQNHLALASAKIALERDIQSYLCNEFYCIGVKALSPNGEEIGADYLGGCDSDYVSSGSAFFENNMVEQMLDAIEDDYALSNPHAISNNYAHAAYI